METLIAILSSVMVVGGIVITTRQIKPLYQLIIGITMIVLGTLVILL